MCLNKSSIFLFLLYSSLFFLVQTQNQVIVYPVDNNITQYCNKNVYFFEFKVRFSQKLDKIIPFEMIIPLPNSLPFKCVIDGPNSKILCFHSFSNYVWYLSEESRIELPYSFPIIEGIRWDYDSFLTKVYRHLWRTNGDCGLLLENMNQDNNINNQIKEELKKSNEKKNEFIANIEEIYGGECHSSKYDYSFEMQINFIKLNDEELLDELKNAKNMKKTIKINFLHNISVPVLLGEKKGKGTTSFRKDYEYKYAYCKYSSDITQNNFDNEDGLIFECHLQVNRYSRFQGPLQIKPFTDYVYINKIGIDGKLSTKMVGIQFEILSSTNPDEIDDEEEEEEEEIEENEVKINDSPTQEIKMENTIVQSKSEEKKPVEKSNTQNMIDTTKPAEVKKRNLKKKNKVNIEPNFLILDSNLDVFICPDKPILTIKNYDEGISFGGISYSSSKYLFFIFGFLSNGYDFSNDTLTLLEMTKDEIKFDLKIFDNLEGPDNKKKLAKCTIPSGTSINKNDLIEIRCIGARPNLENNNTDLILNWNLEENNHFDNIVIRWPYDTTKKKHLFYYNIQGLSVKKDDYGCFENKFFFFLYVYDLKAKPKISFNLPLVYPKNTHAVCKLYNSVTFKCVIDLRLKRVYKGKQIIISNDWQYLQNKEKNLILYSTNKNTTPSELDFSLPVNENCGDFILIGALKEVGYTYLQVLLIIIGCTAGLAICIAGIFFCIIYEITHRNKKGKYYKYTEELPSHYISHIKSPVPK